MGIQNNKNKIREYIKVHKIHKSILGEIKINQCIGEGGNALVYEVTLGKKVLVMKILAEKFQTHSTKLRRFIMEFREIVQLADTKAVVPIYYFGKIAINNVSFPYILMKKFHCTLKSWVKSNQITKFEDFSHILEQLFNKINILHNEGIVHRDLKPENILISSENELVIADFGISWFDPQVYERNYKTKKSDRMANYDFSAPEQFTKGCSIKPTMDIFAIGQIITWLVTGNVARGQRIPLNQFDESYTPLEPVVRGMLSINPIERPQSVKEVKELLQLNSKDYIERTKYNRETHYVLNNLNKFDEAIIHEFPGKRGLIWITERSKINSMMHQLQHLIKNTDLWWTQGSSSNAIKNISILDDEKWIIDHRETQIEKMWIYRNNYSIDHQYILIQTKALRDFDVYKENGFYSSEAAWFKGSYITRLEYDDGVAEIKGKTVKLNGKAELRLRDLKTQYYFIATASHPIVLMKNEQIVSAVYNNIMKNNDIKKGDIEVLNKLKRNNISVMLS